MKTNKKSFIFAIILGVLVIGLPEASKASDKNKEEKIDGAILANGSEVKFATYIGSLLPEYKNQENWSIIEEVVTLYNQQPSKIRSMSAEVNNTFELAVTDLSKKLVVLNSKEALQWKSDLEKTAGAVRFVRNFDINSIATEHIEMTGLKAPLSVSTL